MLVSATYTAAVDVSMVRIIRPSAGRTDLEIIIKISPQTGSQRLSNDAYWKIPRQSSIPVPLICKTSFPGKYARPLLVCALGICSDGRRHRAMVTNLLVRPLPNDELHQIRRRNAALRD